MQEVGEVRISTQIMMGKTDVIISFIIGGIVEAQVFLLSTTHVI